MAFKNKSNKKVEVTFFPKEKKVTFFKPVSLRKAASEADVGLFFPCGGRGICGKCKVKIKGKVNPPTQKERQVIFKELKKGYRLACQVVLEGDAEVEVPKSSLLSTLQILTMDSKETLEINPSIKKVFITLTPPSLKDQLSDITRIKRELKKRGWDQLKVELEVLRKVPSVLRKSGFRVSCVLDGERLIAVEKGDTRGKNFGVAFDVGTTTIVGSLVDLDTGEKIATKAVLNPQNVYGYDVISRISYVQQTNSKGLLELQKRVIGGVNKLINDLTKEAKVGKNNVYQATLVGNTVMQHLFAGVNPLNLSLYPFVPVIQDAISIKSSELKLKINPSAHVYIFPNIAAFVGGDTVGVILSTGMHKLTDRIVLAVDIGTNGEIVLSHQGKLVAASTAAGPAFEGMRISQGMWAEEGAIEKVKLREGKIFVEVIGKGEAKGICGSGLIDIVSELYKEGIIDTSGRMKPRDQQSKLWEDRVIEKDGERQFLLLERKDKSPIFITQKDIREFQLAKAAICTGIRVLLNKLDVEKEQVQEFLIAGAFGNYINLKSAYKVGLFPIFPNAKIRSVGNAASFGAIKALVSQDARNEAEKIPPLVEHVELASHPNFQNILSKSMFLGEVG